MKITTPPREFNLFLFIYPVLHVFIPPPPAGSQLLQFGSQLVRCSTGKIALHHNLIGMTAVLVGAVISGSGTVEQQQRQRQGPWHTVLAHAADCRLRLVQGEYQAYSVPDCDFAESARGGHIQLIFMIVETLACILINVTGL